MSDVADHLRTFLGNVFADSAITKTTLVLGAVASGKTTAVRAFFAQCQEYTPLWMDTTTNRNESVIATLGKPMSTESTLHLMLGQRRKLVAVLDDINTMPVVDTTGFHALLKMIRGNKNKIPIVLVGTLPTIDVHDSIVRACGDTSPFVVGISSSSSSSSSGHVVKPQPADKENVDTFLMHQCRRWRLSRHELMQRAHSLLINRGTKKQSVEAWCLLFSTETTPVSVADEKNIVALLALADRHFFRTAVLPSEDTTTTTTTPPPKRRTPQRSPCQVASQPHPVGPSRKLVVKKPNSSSKKKYTTTNARTVAVVDAAVTEAANDNMM